VGCYVDSADGGWVGPSHLINVLEYGFSPYTKLNINMVLGVVPCVCPLYLTWDRVD
jgi:hypothetical protein